MSMIIVLPEQIDGLQSIVDNITKLNWTKHWRESYPREVDLFLPRFEIETKIDLKKTLRKVYRINNILISMIFLSIPRYITYSYRYVLAGVGHHFQGRSKLFWYS